jgi:hypothetical protein
LVAQMVSRFPPKLPANAAQTRLFAQFTAI